ncbi:MAG: type I DNA topoisomerase [Candidatus Sumerlaeota bacterium]
MTTKKTTTKSSTKKTTKKSTSKKSTSRGASGAKNLVVVESPAKARSINNYLGKDFTVKASVGHVLDLPKSKLGVDIENNFTPELVTIRGKKKTIDELKKAAKNAQTVYLATDPDREGEAIAWHIAKALQLDPDKMRRATFNEITPNAVREAIANPGAIDENLCMAQQTRRVLDRLVGYQISPLLWKNVRRGLSAGRVQSVAVRLVCEREGEIVAFEPQEYWTIEAEVEGKNPPTFRLKLTKVDDKKPAIGNEDDATAILKELRSQTLTVGNVEKKPGKRNPSPPFITSTLQQEAARRLHLSPRRTMAVAQGLYEGVNIGGGSTVGLITYMRTDSTRLSNDAVKNIRGFIKDKFGGEYVPVKPNVYRGKKGAQDAHEAIRPTQLDRPPETLKQYLDDEQYALYEQIWNRFVACQMAPAKLERTTIEVPLSDGKYLMTAKGSVVTFPGFLKLYEESREENDKPDESDGKTLPKVEKGEALMAHEWLPEQHFTQPPPRYSMSSLIRELERRGIGRPSTYAAIVSTILDKKYVERIEGYFRPTELGNVVTDILVDSFPEILDVEFTAKMEQELDEVEEGDREWLEVMREFYKGFEERLEKAKTEMRSPRTEERPTDIDCPECGAKMVVKWGKNGRFLACTNYPDCKGTLPCEIKADGSVEVEEVPTTDAVCEKCGAPMQVKRGRRGSFLACSNYPDCKNTRNILEVKDGKAIPADALPDTDEVCEKCGSPMAVKNSRRGPFLACTGFPKCRNAKNIAEIKDGKAVAEHLPETDEVCEKCGKPMTVKSGKRGLFLACTGYPKCRNSKPYEGPEAEEYAEKAKAKKASAPKASKPKPIETEEKCENCGKKMLLRQGRNGWFLGCSGYPKCKTTRQAEPELVEKYTEK